MISIITCAHKEIPWWKLVTISVLQQTSSEWEWIILDNSENNFASSFLNSFFDDEENKKYLDRRNNIKIYWEYDRFKNIRISDGKIGKLKNRALELSSCDDNEFVILLDYDDFLNDRTIEYINKASKVYPNVEYMESYRGIVLYEYTENKFYSYDALMSAMRDTLYYSIFKKGYLYREYYHKDNSFTKICDRIDAGEIDGFKFIPYKFDLNLDKKNMHFENIIYREYWNPFSGASHMHAFKKGIFRDYIGGFNENFPTEDTISFYKITFMLNSCIIQYPCYITTIATNGETVQNTGFNEEYSVHSNNSRLNYIMNDICKLRHDMYNSWDYLLYPKKYNPENN